MCARAPLCVCVCVSVCVCVCVCVSVRARGRARVTFGFSVCVCCINQVASQNQFEVNQWQIQARPSNIGIPGLNGSLPFSLPLPVVTASSAEPSRLNRAKWQAKLPPAVCLIQTQSAFPPQTGVGSTATLPTPPPRLKRLWSVDTYCLVTWLCLSQLTKR